MKRFECRCGGRIYFENTDCLSCGSRVGFDPDAMQMVATGPRGTEPLERGYRQCRNTLEFDNCNWLVSAGSSEEYCISCHLNRTIPHLGSGDNLSRWATLEKEKRRMLYSLLDLGLAVQSKARGWPDGLAFDFVEDQRSNPAVTETFISTGHHDGVITINVAEADPLHRLQMRLALGEVYRTVLGHFRHESGHYYYRLLIGDHNVVAFRTLFGDERTDYAAALDEYYNRGGGARWGPGFITAYAGAHPLEDWAECWAHFLLIRDCLETAGAETGEAIPGDFNELMAQWMGYAIHLNQIARSLGLEDPYPFVLSEEVRNKLEFIDQAARTGNPQIV